MLTMEDLERYAKLDSYAYVQNNLQIDEPFPGLLELQEDEPGFCNICGIDGLEDETICARCEIEFPVIEQPTEKDKRLIEKIKNFIKTNLTGETLNET